MVSSILRRRILITFSMAGKLRINKDASGGAVGVNVMSDKEVKTY